MNNPITQCLNCQKDFKKLSSGQRFCARPCSASYNNARRKPRTIESRLKTSESIKRANAEGRKSNPGPNKILVTRILRKTCVICSIDFWASGENRKKRLTCSRNCAATNSSMNKVRKTSIPFIEPITGRSISLQSTWERMIAEKMNELGIIWQRPSRRLKWIDSEKKTRTYLPDFYLQHLDTYLDVKNSIGLDQQYEKLSTMSLQINLVALELKPMITWLEALSP